MKDKYRKKKVLLTAAVVCRNEEQNIGNCIRSILEDMRGIDSEVLIVDSFSTDRTLEIAKKYPVRIIQLEHSRHLSPSAGRYIGTKYSQGKYIMFVDADTIIVKGWSRAALAKLETDENIGGIRGRLYRVRPGNPIDRRYKEKLPLGTANPLPGQVSVYRKEALDSFGTFNPFLRGEEERELFHRASKTRYKLLNTDMPMAYHIDKKIDASEVDEKASYYMGVGQIFRKYKFGKITLDLIMIHKGALSEIAGMLLAPIIIIVLFALKMTHYASILLAAAAAAAIFIMIIKGPRKIILRLRSRSKIAVNIVKGFLKGIMESSQYDACVKARWIKR